MSYFMIKSDFDESSGSNINGFVIVENRSLEEITKKLEEFVEQNGEEYFYTDYNVIYNMTMDGFEIVELSEEEFNVVDKLFGLSGGTPIPDDLFED